MSTKDLETVIADKATALVDKAVPGLERIDSNSECCLWVKCNQTTPHATEELFMKGRVNRCGKLHCCLISRNCHSQPNLQQPPPYQ